MIIFSKGCSSRSKLIRVLTKIIFPFIYKYFYPSRNNISTDSDIIISLTTFPKRIKFIDLVIKSLLNQNKDINSIYLFVSQEDNFTEKHKRKLKNLKNINVQWVKGNIKSHKKYFYAFKNFGEHFNIITVDDDIIYDESLIHTLYETYKTNKGVTCSIARNIKVKNNKYSGYTQWNNTNPLNPPKDILPIGAGGVFYPKGQFHRIKLTEKEILETCPNADDLLLYFMSKELKLKNFIAKKILFSVPLPYKLENSLYHKNVLGKENDLQLKQILNILETKTLIK